MSVFVRGMRIVGVVMVFFCGGCAALEQSGSKVVQGFQRLDAWVQEKVW